MFLNPLGRASATRSGDPRYLCLQQWRRVLLCPVKFRGWGSPTLVGASALGQPHRPRLLLPYRPQVISWSKVFAHPQSPAFQPAGHKPGYGKGGRWSPAVFQAGFPEAVTQHTTYSHWPERRHMAMPSSSRGWERSSLFWANRFHKRACGCSRLSRFMPR